MEPTRWQKLAPFVLIAAGVTVYANSFSGVFVLDDIPHILENPSIRRLWPPWDIFTYSWRPFLFLSLALNYALGGWNVLGYHVFNLLIHILTALVLYGIVRRTLSRKLLATTYQPHARGLALSVALIWTVHPLQTQSVTYVIQRSEAMMGLFCLLTLYCFIRGMELPEGQKWWFVAAALSCAIGTGCKEVIITAPLIVLTYDKIFLAGSFSRALRERKQLYAALAASWILLAFWQLQAEQRGNLSAGFGYKEVNSMEYACSQPAVILHYLRIAYWPHPLAFDYFWPVAHGMKEILLPALVLIIIVGGTLWALWHQLAISFLGVFFFLVLSLTSSVMPIADLAVEHRMYLPLAAPITLAVMAGYHCLQSVARRFPPNKTIIFSGGMCVVSSVVILLGWLTIQRNSDYHSAIRLWEDTAAKRPNNPRAHNNLGTALYKEGRRQEAIHHYSEALRLKPAYTMAHANIAMPLAEEGKMEVAMKHILEAKRLGPDIAQVHHNLGTLFAQQNKLEEAVAAYREALRLNPNYAHAHNNLAIALVQQGKLEEAITHFRQALHQNPFLEQSHNSLGFALAKLDRIEEAISHYREALRLKPNYAQAHHNLAIVLARKGDLDDAILHYQEAIRLKPDDAITEHNLAIALVRRGNLDSAILHFKKALQLRPDFAEAQKNLRTTESLRSQKSP